MSAKPVSPTEEQARGLSSHSQENWEGVERALKDSKELSVFAFTGGLSLLVLGGFVLGRYPSNFFLVYCPSVLILTPIWYYFEYAKGGGYMILKICWVNSLFICLIIIATCFGFRLSDHYKRTLWIWFMMSSTPQGWAVILHGNALVFHSPRHMANIAIHLLTPMMAAAIFWNQGNTHLDAHFKLPRHELPGPLEMLSTAMKVYMFWWVPYTIWMLCDGYRVDDRQRCSGFSKTAFSSSGFTNDVPQNLPLRIKVLLYMLVHILQNVAGWLSFFVITWFRIVNDLWLIGLFIFTCFKAGEHYTRMVKHLAVFAEEHLPPSSSRV